MPMNALEQMDNEMCPVREYRVLVFQGPMKIPVCSHDDVNAIENVSLQGQICDADLVENHRITK